MTKPRPRILLVEDSPSDQIIIQRSIEDGRIACDLTIAENGKQALQMLQRQEPHQATFNELPDLIMMDINMPIMNGKETLQAIRKDKLIKHIPVIMLTTSSHEKDVMESYQLGVNAYLTKPISDDGFIDIVAHIEQFWLELVVLPPKGMA